MRTNSWKIPLVISAILLQMALIAAPAKAATFMVTNAADSGPGSLRWAIEQTNAAAGEDTILFDNSYIIPIYLTELPPLSDQTGGTTIDGGGNTVIIESWASYSILKYGLKITSNYNTIKNLQVRNISPSTPVFGYGIGISITGSDNIISSCKIYKYGTCGIVLGALPQTSTVFAADGGRSSGAPLSNNRIQSCFIGTADGSTTASPGSYSQQTGILGTENAFNNFFGVDGDGSNDHIEGNVISGNYTQQIVLYGRGNVIAGNMIGTDRTGGYRISSTSSGGILLHQNAFNTIIGTNSDGISDLLERNIISGNSYEIQVHGFTSGVRISGNYIGTDSTGSFSLKGNGGIFIHNAPYISPPYPALTADTPSPIVIGTNGDGINDGIEGNVISAGILLSGGDSLIYPLSGNGVDGGVKISGNLIGTDASGTRVLPWPSEIRLSNSSNNVIGTDGDGLSDELEGNVIASPVSLERSASIRRISSNYNRIAGNNFWVDRTGNQMLANDGIIYPVTAVSVQYGIGNTIGTNGDGISDDLEGNIFANININTTATVYGVVIAVAYGSTNRISGNIIGMSLDGRNILGDGGRDGITLYSEWNSLIGTNGDGISDELEGNILLGNHKGGGGIGIASGSNNRVSGNYIGTGPNGSLISGFGGPGILVKSTTSNLIGTNHDGLSDDLEANIITDNGHAPSSYYPLYNDGISIGIRATFNSIQGNSIYNNIGMGIDLIDGGNYNFAAPVITSITHDGASFVVTGTAPAGSMVEIFIADGNTLGGNGEGKFYLDRALASDGTFTFYLNNIGVDDFLTATATDVNGNTSEFSQTVDFSGHLPPTINPIDDQTIDTGSLLTFAITATSPHNLPVEITTAELPVGASFDGSNFSWTPEYNQAGLLNVTFVASDGQSSSSKRVMITVNAVNSPPALATTGGGVFNLQEVITLGAQVNDPDGDQLTYRWSEGATTICSGTVATTYGGAPINLPSCQLPAGQTLGSHTYDLEVSDSYNAPVSGAVAITIQDTNAPTLAPTINKTILWPPDHKMVDVVINSNAKDDSGCLTLTVEVGSNEPESGLSSGDNSPDFSEPLIDPRSGAISLQLRAERDGRGAGRVYLITVIATDCSGNSSSTSIEVLCPHDKIHYSNDEESQS